MAKQSWRLLRKVKAALRRNTALLSLHPTHAAALQPAVPPCRGKSGNTEEGQRGRNCAPVPKTDYVTVGCSRKQTFKARFLAALPVFTGKEEPLDQLPAVAMRKLAENVLHLKGRAATTGSSIFALKIPQDGGVLCALPGGIEDLQV